MKHPKRDSIDAAALKSRIDLRDLVESVWGPGRRSGKTVMYRARWRGDDDTASFAVYADGFKDFGANLNGDHFDFLQHEYGMDFPEALAWLIDFVGGNPDLITPTQTTPATSTAHAEPPTSEWQHSARVLIQQMQTNLWANPQILDYLRSVRGLNDATIRAAGLGYNPDWHKTDLSKEDGKDVYLAPGIVIPWEIDDVIWAVRVRTHIGDLAKHLNMAEATNRSGRRLSKYLNLYGSKPSAALYNAETLADKTQALIVEGEFDTLLAAQHLPEVAVISIGSASNPLSHRWRKRLDNYERIVISTDNDRAGQAAAEKLRAAFPDQAQVATLPAGKDVTDYVMGQGADLVTWWRSLKGSWWPNGLPQGWASAMLNVMPTNVTTLVYRVDQAIRAGELDPERITRPRLVELSAKYGWNMSENRIYRAFQTVVGILFTEVDTDSFPTIPSDDTDTPATETVDKSAKKTTGRPEALYKIVPINQIRAHLEDLLWLRTVEEYHPGTGSSAVLARPTPRMIADLDLSHGDPDAIAEELEVIYAELYPLQDKKQERTQKKVLRTYSRWKTRLDDPKPLVLAEGWPVENDKTLRVALLHTVISENDRLYGESRMAWRDIQELVGISHGSVTKYLAAASVENVPQYEDKSVKDPKNLSVQIKRWSGQVRGRAMNMTIIDLIMETVGWYPLDDLKAAQDVAATALAAGHEVQIRFQVVSKQEIISDKPPGKDSSSQETDKNKKMLSRSRPPVKLPRSPRRAKRRYYGRRFDPVWLRDQLLLALILQGDFRENAEDPNLVWDMETGESVARDAIHSQDLLEMLLGRQLDPVIAAAVELGGVLIPRHRLARPEQRDDDSNNSSPQ